MSKLRDELRNATELQQIAFLCVGLVSGDLLPSVREPAVASLPFF